MAQTWFKRSNNNIFVVYGGKTYIFDRFRKFVKDSIMLPHHYVGGVEVNVISILTTNTGLSQSFSLGIAHKDIFKDYIVSGIDDATLNSFLFDQKNYITFLERTGEIRGTKYRQMLYIYQDSFYTVDMLKYLRNTLGFSLHN